MDLSVWAADADSQVTIRDDKLKSGLSNEDRPKSEIAKSEGIITTRMYRIVIIPSFWIVWGEERWFKL